MARYVIKLSTIIATFAALFINYASAANIEGVEVEEILLPDGERPTLYLNGTAKRQFLMFVDVYVGALYVEKTSSEANDLIHSDGYRRMEFHMLRNVRGRRIANAFYEGIRLNLKKEEAQAMEGAIDQMVALFDQKLREGDKAVVEYVPGKGTQVILAGRQRGIIPNKDLFDAILAIWIGEYPVSKEFKAGILNYDPVTVAGENGRHRGILDTL